MRDHAQPPRTRRPCSPPLAALALLGGACLEPPPGGSQAEEAQAAVSAALVASGTLGLVQERKLSKIIPLSGVNDYEASGVQLHGGLLYIVFDNMTKIGRVALDLQSGSYASGGSSSNKSQYEGITFDDYSTQHFYTVVEQAAAEVVQYDAAASGGSADHQSTNVTLTDGKGFEGIAWLRRSGDDYLLGLCEGFYCTTSHGGAGGRGAIRVMSQTGSSWTADPTYLLLPSAVSFKDYSDLALRPNADGTFQVAVTSQESKALWIGRLSATSWSFLDDGTLYPLPSSDYCNIEGVTFLSPSRVALVSDLSDPQSDPAGCNNKDEMVHIFDLQ